MENRSSKHGNLTILTHKAIMNTAIKYLLIMLTALVTASCSGGDDPSRPAGNRPMQLGFILTFGDTGSRAPSVPEDGYDRGSGYENYINIIDKDFMFLFFDDNNRYVATIDIKSVIPTSSTATSKSYNVLASTTAEIAGRPLKVVALANWGDRYPSTLIPGETTIAEVCETPYGFTPDMMNLSADTTIPLYGVKEYDSLTFDSLDFCDLGVIHLLRAYAKVEVYVSEETSAAGWELDNVELTRYHTSGYLAPASVYKQDDYVHGDYDLDYVPTAHIPADASTGTNLTLVEKSKGKSFIAYVPEYVNSGDNADPAQIRVKLSGPNFSADYEPDWAYITLKKDGDNGEPYDLLRNCWYRIEIYKNLDRVQVQVVPYDEVTLESDYGLLIGADLVPVTDENGQIQFYYDRETGKYYGTDKVTEITNPYDIFDSDPATGFVIIKDINGRAICLYDTKEGKYYVMRRINGINTRVEIYNPYSKVVEDDDPSTPHINEKGWLTFTEVIDDKFICYYDSSTAKYYNYDKEEISSPFSFNNP